MKVLTLNTHSWLEAAPRPAPGPCAPALLAFADYPATQPSGRAAPCAHRPQATG